MNSQDSISIRFWIISQHGRDVLKIAQKLEEVAKNLGAWQNHRHFNLRCLHSNITPRSLLLVSDVKGNAAEKILTRAQKQLLNVRIRQCDFTVKKLTQDQTNPIWLQTTSVAKQQIASHHYSCLVILFLILFISFKNL